MPRRASRKELTDALSSHYGSPGRLANYRREFDKTIRKPGEDPSNFAITLETLAVKAFGDMGQTARLRLIRDQFIAGHGSCELRRYLDCVPPDTPLRDIVDRCRVWESHADPEVRRVSKPMPEPAYPTYVVNDIAKDGYGPPAGGKRRLIRREGFASRISKNARPHDPGGGGDNWFPRPSERYEDGHYDITQGHC